MAVIDLPSLEWLILALDDTKVGNKMDANFLIQNELRRTHSIG
jgi:hypothetical protein